MRWVLLQSGCCQEVGIIFWNILVILISDEALLKGLKKQQLLIVVRKRSFLCIFCDLDNVLISVYAHHAYGVVLSLSCSIIVRKQFCLMLIFCVCEIIYVQQESNKAQPTLSSWSPPPSTVVQLSAAFLSHFYFFLHCGIYIVWLLNKVGQPFNYLSLLFCLCCFPFCLFLFYFWEIS